MNRPILSKAHSLPSDAVELPRRRSVVGCPDDEGRRVHEPPLLRPDEGVIIKVQT
jgi:hypothetical protein